MHRLLPILMTLLFSAPLLGQVVAEEYILLPVTPGRDFDSVAIDGETLIVGASTDSQVGTRAGATYWFDLIERVEIDKTFADEPMPRDVFGDNIATAAGLTLVSAPTENGSASGLGRVQLFTTDGRTLISEFSAEDQLPGDSFAASLAIDGPLVAVGAPDDNNDGGMRAGAAYLFSPAGIELAKVLPSDPDVGDAFGFEVALEGNILAIGAPADNDQGGDSGSIYIFNAETQKERFKITAKDGEPFDFFGSVFDLSNGILAVGVSGDDDNGTSSGSAYLFDADTGAFIIKLLPSEGAQLDLFGISIAISKDYVVVGATGYDEAIDLPDVGAVFVFDVKSGEQIARLRPSDFEPNMRFGAQFAVSGTRIVVPTRRKVYVFDLDLDPGDLNCDLVFNSADIDPFVLALLDPAQYELAFPECDIKLADMNDDGFVNTSDIDIFVNQLLGDD